MKHCYDCNHKIPEEVARLLAGMTRLVIEAGGQDMESAEGFSIQYIRCVGSGLTYIDGTVVLCGACIENALRQSTGEGGV